MRRSGRRAAVVAAAAGVIVLSSAPAVPAQSDQGNPVAVEVVADAAEALGPTNPALRGFVWNSGPIDGIIPLQPHAIRIDASLSSASQGADQLDLSRLLAEIAEVRRAGAEPLVILSYMPAWLADTVPGDPRDPSRVGPRDLDAWQHLIEQVVEGVATVPGGTRRFEVWNEPNLPVFWQDTAVAFQQMALRTHQAVAAVEERTGLDLDVGGPATALGPDPTYIVPYQQVTTAAGLPPDFISWHWYFSFGQDGNEGQVPDPVYELLTVGDNPLNTPAAFGTQIAAVRSLVGDEIELMIDEWNVAGGGYDLRHDTHVGAAFQAGSLIEMERAGLDAAYLYRGTSSGTQPGDWAVIDASGIPKPAWWVFDAWRQTEGTRIGVSGYDPEGGVFTRATRSEDHVDVIVSSFPVTARDVVATVRVANFEARCSTVRVIDSPADSFAGQGDQVEAATATIRLSPPSVAWVRFHRTCPTGAGSPLVTLPSVASGNPAAPTLRSPATLPATGTASPTPLAVAAFVLAAGILVKSGGRSARSIGCDAGFRRGNVRGCEGFASGTRRTLGRRR